MTGIAPSILRHATPPRKSKHKNGAVDIGISFITVFSPKKGQVINQLSLISFVHEWDAQPEQIDN